MSESDNHPFLYSVASSVLRKLDECNVEQFGGNSEEVAMLKGLLTQLPLIISSRPESLSVIYESVCGLRDLLKKKNNNKKKVHSSLNPSWSDLIYPLAKLQDDHGFKFENLPPHLVPCVVYCGLHPKGSRIVCETLVNQWMAEGFLDLQTGEMELEEIGDCYFMELLSMGVFVEPVYRFGDHFGGNHRVLMKVHSCKLHPIVHDKAREILSHYLRSPPRTCIFSVPLKVVLDLSGSDFEELPPTFHKETDRLLYLAFSRNTRLKRIDEIDWDWMHELQTFAVDGCIELEKFNNLEHATLLRHLYYTSKQPTLEIHTSNLRILQLSHCLNLRSLLSLSNHASFEALRRLRIFDCPRLVSFPDTIHLLPRLEELVIHNCARLHLSNTRWFYYLPRLQHMELIGLPKMTALPDGLQSASALQYLMIADCISLRSIDHVLPCFCTLKKLCVYDCPVLSVSPYVFQSLTALQSLDIRNCQKVTARSKHHLKRFISHIPQVIFDGQPFLTQNDAALGSGLSSFCAPSNYCFPKKFPYFILNMEKNIKLPQGMTYEEYKLKITYTWIPLRAMIRMRVLLRQTMFCYHLFPSVFEFEKEKLEQLWMDRGLLADTLFSNLLAKGYILKSRTDKLTGISWYRINDKMVVPTVLDRVKDTSTSLHHFGGKVHPAVCQWAQYLICSEALVMTDDQIHRKAWNYQEEHDGSTHIHASDESSLSFNGQVNNLYIAQQLVISQTSPEDGGFFRFITGCNFNIGSGTQTSGDVNIHSEVGRQQNLHLNLNIQSKNFIPNKINGIIVPLSLLTFFALIVICGLYIIKGQNWPQQHQLGPRCMKQYQFDRMYMTAPT